MEYNYKKFTPFKMQCLTNFPFIDEDFDALSNYGLLCKIVEYMNNIATNNNLLVDNINDLNNWFKNLDVQDEINKKLDEMAESGELDLVIKKYVDPIYQAFENEVNTKIENQDDIINNFKSQINLQVGKINTKVNSVASGSPSGVYTTLNELITADPDHTKIYVVEDDGKWYYYDDNTSNWVAGGTYQSTVIDPDSPNLISMVRGYQFITDNTLDDTNNDLKNIKSNRIYLYYVSENSISNLPSEVTIVNSKNLFIVYKFSYSNNDSNYVMFLIDMSINSNPAYAYNNNKMFVTTNNGVHDTFEWQRLSNFNNSININEYVYNENVTETNKDLNNAKFNSITSYYLRGNEFLNAPIDMNSSSFYYLNVLSFGFNNNFYSQICIDLIGNNKFYYRSYNGTQWSNWIVLNNEVDLSNINEFIDYSYLTTIIQEPLDIKNKSLTFAGDSITAGNFIGSTNVWAKWLSDKLNASYTNVAIGGATFAPVPSRPELEQIINEINNTSLNPVLFIAGGINDFSQNVSKSDFTNAVTDLCSWLNNNYTGEVIFVTPVNHVMTNITNTIPLNWYREEITRIALLNGYSVIAGNELGFPTKSGDMSSLLFYDTVHPSVDGQKMYANKVYQILK